MTAFYHYSNFKIKVFTMEIGEVLALARKAAALYQADISKQTGITKTNISQIENGSNLTPRLTTIKAISKALNIPLGALFWLTLEVDEIPPHKREQFKAVKPLFDDMIFSIFFEDKPRFKETLKKAMDDVTDAL